MPQNRTARKLDDLLKEVNEIYDLYHDMANAGSMNRVGDYRATFRDTRANVFGFSDSIEDILGDLPADSPVSAPLDKAIDKLDMLTAAMENDKTQGDQDAMNMASDDMKAISGLVELARNLAAETLATAASFMAGYRTALRELNGEGF